MATVATHTPRISPSAALRPGPAAPLRADALQAEASPAVTSPPSTVAANSRRDIRLIPTPPQHLVPAR
ncbi:hypothetical protein GCM10010145_30500 [Streptomyces ruber]|uniref:Uncharacterized protein n=2 Tax=Streptomyces TaxID=1883 RepID=A0A918BCN5_9ACTN|nr:hypothetical protein GCM10010145_30500 [Streptomyces ruber]